MSSRPPDDDPIRRLPNRALIEAEKQRRRSAFLTLFPDTGPL